MTSSTIQREIIVVRSLTDSDLGIFAANRDRIRSKQRAININAAVAKRMLGPQIIVQGSCRLECKCIFRTILDRSPRYLKKIHKNWRLGGNKLEGADFGLIDSKDFVLIRTKAGNDGTYPISIAFISRKSDNPADHENVVSAVKGLLDHSMAIFEEGTAEYKRIVRLVPPPDRRIARKLIVETIRQTELTLWMF